MMGTSHALTGVIIGCPVVFGEELIAAPIPVRVLTLAVCGGAALLPDIDHPSSTVAHALGPITWLASKATDRFALWVYHSTRTHKDPASRESGHRLVTHTPVGSAGFGLLMGLACFAGPVSAGIAIGLVSGLLCGALRRHVRYLVKATLGIREGAAVLVAAGSGVAGYLVSERYPGWWWLYAVAVFIGAWIHREGDWCTNSGVPRRNWPVVKNGRRWDKSKAPKTFETGKETELFTVRLLLYCGSIIGLAAVTGGVRLVLAAGPWAIAAAAIAVVLGGLALVGSGASRR